MKEDELGLILFLLVLICIEHSSSTKGRRNADGVLFIPIIYDTAKDEGTVTVRLSTFTLYLSQHKLPPFFISTYFDESGEAMQTNLSNCYFGGSVEGFPKWVVTMNMCNGLRGQFGSFTDPEHYYRVTPVENRENNYTIHQPHVLFTDNFQSSGNISGHGVCASLPHNGFKLQVEAQMVADINKTGPPPGWRVVELISVNDYAQYVNNRRSIVSVILRNIEIVDYMNRLYREFKVRIELVGVVTWSRGDFIPLTTRPMQILLNFKDYYKHIPGSFDCALLISGTNLFGTTVGLAFKGSMCFMHFAVGVVQDARGALNAVGGTATHELGHILGMSHDDTDARVCRCTDPSGRCLMSSISTSHSPTVWSSCNYNDMLASFAMTPWSESCLYNEPDGVLWTKDFGSKSFRIVSSITLIAAGLVAVIFPP